MKNIISRSVFLVFITFLFGCNSEMKIKDLGSFLHDEDNGFVISKKVNDIEITCKVIPSEIMAYNELKHLNVIKNNVFDSVITTYKNQLSIKLSIQSEEGNSSLKLLNSNSVEEYQKHLEKMYYSISEAVSLNINGASYKPVLTEMNNYNQMQSQKEFLLVFVQEDENDNDFSSENPTIAFNDLWFNTGITQFNFERNDLNNIPTIKIN